MVGAMRVLAGAKLAGRPAAGSLTALIAGQLSNIARTMTLSQRRSVQDEAEWLTRLRERKQPPRPVGWRRNARPGDAQDQGTGGPPGRRPAGRCRRCRRNFRHGDSRWLNCNGDQGMKLFGLGHE